MIFHLIEHSASSYKHARGDGPNSHPETTEMIIHSAPTELCITDHFVTLKFPQNIFTWERKLYKKSFITQLVRVLKASLLVGTDKPQQILVNNTKEEVTCNDVLSFAMEVLDKKAP